VSEDDRRYGLELYVNEERSSVMRERADFASEEAAENELRLRWKALDISTQLHFIMRSKAERERPASRVSGRKIKVSN
jgi:hypothetical protein